MINLSVLNKCEYMKYKLTGMKLYYKISGIFVTLVGEKATDPPFIEMLIFVHSCTQEYC